MKIAHIVVGSIIVLFVVFAIHGYITLDINLTELQNSVELRNEAQANKLMQNLDKYIKDRLDDYISLSNSDEIHNAVSLSNEKFRQQLSSGTTISNGNENMIPFLSNNSYTLLSGNFTNFLDLYKQEYGYDIGNGLYVTNQYGAFVNIGGEASKYIYSNESWWQAAKNYGVYFGKLQIDPILHTYSIPLALRIDDEKGNFIGIMKTSMDIDSILHDFKNDASILKVTGKKVILLDDNGKQIYNEEIVLYPSSKPVPFYNKFTEDNGFFETDNDTNPQLVAYSKSIGYGTFVGFDWITLVEQDRSVVTSEFVDARNSILLISGIGIATSLVIGLVVSVSIANPLMKVSTLAQRLSKGDFTVHMKKSHLREINIISESFNSMTDSLKKLVETERKLAEAHVKIKNERLSAIGELAASLAHNLKNPLATIRSSADILRQTYKDENNKEIQEVMQRMNRAIDRMTSQIDDVLNYVRVTSLHLEKTTVKTILSNVIKSLEIPSNITIKTPGNDYELNCDIRKFEVLFTNIILNAVQAIGKEKGRIDIHAREEGEFLVIDVQDSGSGIPNELFPRLFEPLISTKMQGTGLGLSTSKNIVEQHDGTISVKNNPTTFTIKLPKRI